MPYFEYRQNNSGGSFDIDDYDGLGPRVWIEAASASDADERAIRLGIYFNGCEDDRDCPCCGDRWSTAWGDGERSPEIDTQDDFTWHDAVYIHHKDGTIERITRAEKQS